MKGVDRHPPLHRLNRNLLWYYCGEKDMTDKMFAEVLTRFDYDQALPLDVIESNAEQKEGVSILELSYASPANKRVKAYWVTPPGEGPFPGVLFVHPGPGDRSTFLDEAVLLAQKGAASLLVDAPWSAGEAWGRTLGQPEGDRQILSQIVKDFRRAIDVVASRSEADAQRIGYVGHSFGALFGGVLAGVEQRIKAYILMAGVGSFTDLAVLNMPFLTGSALEAYRQAMEPIDPIHYVGQAAPAALFFQFGRQDNFFEPEKFEAYAAAGSEPKSVKWYNTDHYFSNNEARQDRIEWLRLQLGLK
jgi:dienelactone hydrolase